MKKFYLKKMLLSVTMLLCSVVASAFKVDSLYYNVTSETDLTVEVIRGENFSGEIIIPSTVVYDEKTYSVTSIGRKAFYRCTSLTSIVIPNSVTSIGEDAFYNCFRLTSIVIPNSVTSIGKRAFSDCSGLTSIVIPNSVTSIGVNAFSDCKGLTSVTIPNSVTSIGNSAFSGCSGLTSVTIPDSVTSIGNSAFSGCKGLTSIVIPNSVTSIEDKAFYNCTKLKKVINFSNLVFEPRSSNNGYIAYYTYEVINAHNGSIEGDFIFGIIDGVNTLQYYLGNDTEITLPNNYKGENYVIGDNVFSYREGLASVTIPNSVTSIGYSAFAGCSGLTSITIPNNVTSIEEGTFRFCSSLTSITIPNSVTSIGNYAFGGCSGLTSVTIPNSVTSIGYSAFEGCSGLTSVTIPNSVTSIGSGAFSGCSGLTSITIPNSVTSIGVYAFAGCAGLTSITIPNNVTSIEEGTFRFCSGLTSITIPNSVTSIGKNAFYGCSGLTSIIVEEGNSVYDSRDNCNAIIETATNTLVQGCNNTVIPGNATSIGHHAFYNCSDLTSVIIPKSVTSIGYNAFGDCAGLTSIIVEEGNSVYDSRDNCNAIIETATNWLIKGCKNTIIPNSVTSIGGDAFSGCTGLTSIEIPESVTSIGSYAFFGCSGLTSIYLFSATPATMYVLDYDNNIYENATLYVPQGSLEAYKAADGWKEFKNIVEFDPTAIEDVTEDVAPAFEVTDGGIQFTAAEGKTVAVYTTAGALVEKTDSYAGEEITLDKGVYIICVGDKAVKVRL